MLHSTDAGLVGKFFDVSYKDKPGVRHKGRVIGDLGGGYFLIALYDWCVDGSPTEHVVPLAQFAASEDWRFRVTFYASEAEWRKRLKYETIPTTLPTAFHIRKIDPRGSLQSEEKVLGLFPRKGS